MYALGASDGAAEPFTLYATAIRSQLKMCSCSTVYVQCMYSVQWNSPAGWRGKIQTRKEHEDDGLTDQQGEMRLS